MVSDTSTSHAGEAYLFACGSFRLRLLVNTREAESPETRYTNTAYGEFLAGSLKSFCVNR